MLLNLIFQKAQIETINIWSNKWPVNRRSAVTSQPVELVGSGMNGRKAN